MTDIKSMKLYTHVERVYNELEEQGISDADALTVADLVGFDQMHYHGSEALDTALELIGGDNPRHWLEIGSGIGGPARYLAATAGINVTALELQPDQNLLAESLSRRCGLETKIQHLCGDFLEYDFAGRQFDAVVSWLALYHIPERPVLIEKSCSLLKPGGRFYTEDLCRMAAIDQQQLSDLQRDLYAITLPDFSAYQADLEAGGFEIESVTDMTADWSQFTHDRLATYRADRDRHVRVQGEATVDALDDFYGAVDHHFQSGKLGGIRLCARRVK